MSMIPGALAVLVVGATAVIASSPDGPKTTNLNGPSWALAGLIPSVSSLTPSFLQRTTSGPAMYPAASQRAASLPATEPLKPAPSGFFGTLGAYSRNVFGSPERPLTLAQTTPTILRTR